MAAASTFDRIFGGPPVHESCSAGRSAATSTASLQKQSNGTQRGHGDFCWRPSQGAHHKNASPPGSPAASARSSLPSSGNARRFCWQADNNASTKDASGPPPPNSPGNGPSGSPVVNSPYRSPRSPPGAGAAPTIEALNKAVGSRVKCQPAPGGPVGRDHYDIDFHPGARRVYESKNRQSNPVLRAGAPGARDETDNLQHDGLSLVQRAPNGVPLNCKRAARRGVQGLRTNSPAFDDDAPSKSHDHLVMATGLRSGGGVCPIERAPRRHIPKAKQTCQSPKSAGGIR